MSESCGGRNRTPLRPARWKADPRPCAFPARLAAAPCGFLEDNFLAHPPLSTPGPPLVTGASPASRHPSPCCKVLASLPLRSAGSPPRAAPAPQCPATGCAP
eukprot:249121-Chlamydomonas_euryale.AAC.5